MRTGFSVAGSSLVASGSPLGFKFSRPPLVFLMLASAQVPSAPISFDGAPSSWRCILSDSPGGSFVRIRFGLLGIAFDGYLRGRYCRRAESESVRYLCFRSPAYTSLNFLVE